VTGVNGQTVTNAKLCLYNKDGADAGGKFYAVTDNTWQEETVTWSNAPTAGTTMLAELGPVSPNNWYEVDLTSHITADGTYSLRVSNSTGGADYSSKEGTNDPKLLVAVAGATPQSCSGTATATSTSGATNTPTRTPTPGPSPTPTSTFTPTSAPTATQPPPGAFNNATFVYDGDGKRVKSVMTTNIGTTTTYFVGAHYEVTGTGVITKYYYAGAQRIAMRTNGTLNYLLGDHLGSTSLVTDATGHNPIETRYKAWGEERYASGTTPTKYTYTGQYSYASDFGLMFYNARWYDPALGRFNQPDTIIPQSQGVQAWDRYAYTFNNPVRYVDPDGHDPITAFLLILAAAAVLTACAPEPAPAPEIASSVNVTDMFGQHNSLATIINSNTALTHNHFDEGPFPLDELFADGRAIDFFDPVGPEIYGTGESQSGLVTIDSDFKGSPAELASQDVISSLDVGNAVQVAYWDDAERELAMGSFTVQAPVSGGALLLNDPDNILNLGDSGGGVFYNGQLIGNLWAENNSMHTIFVAILPPNLTNSSKATTRVK